MKIIPYLPCIFLFAICSAQNKENSFNVNHGVLLERIDSTIKKDIQIVHFAHSSGVIFPEKFGEQHFGKNKWWVGKKYFTPDTNLIKKLDKEISKQYTVALKRFNENNWKEAIERLKADSDTVELKIAQRQKAEQDKRWAKASDRFRNNLAFYDKQYVGFVLESGEKIILIQLLNFREDPYGLKPFFTSRWIDGWHGWFESNRIQMNFHVDKNLITINEDI